jgi:hypothetical protein
MSSREIEWMDMNAAGIVLLLGCRVALEETRWAVLEQPN